MGLGPCWPVDAAAAVVDVDRSRGGRRASRQGGGAAGALQGGRGTRWAGADG